MSIVVNNAIWDASAAAKKAKDEADLKAKRDANRTKYSLVRKADVPVADKDKGLKLVLDGKEVPISDSMKFMLQEMIATPSANTS